MCAAAKRSFDVPAGMAAALDAITLERAGVTLFSQLVADSFVSSSWFDLLRNLEGTVPSPCHDALAALAEEGRLAAVVTTNFDTLLERAFDDRGVPYILRLGGDGGLPSPLAADGRCHLVKVHGSVTDRSSMVDLASQKARGISPALRAWLSRLFSEHALLVLGFSGADLELHESDYFGLEAAMPFVPWLRWIHRGGRAPLAAAATLVAAAPDGEFVRGELPGILGELGLEVPPPRAAGAPGELERRIDSWLSRRGASFDCAVLATRVLMIAGQDEAARGLRSAVRKSLLVAPPSDAAVRLVAAEALSSFGDQQVRDSPADAVADLAKSREMVKGVLADKAELRSDPKVQEFLRDRSATVLLNTAVANVALGELGSAEEALREAGPLIDGLTPETARRQLACASLAKGTLAVARGHHRLALVALRHASVLAEVEGLPRIAMLAAQNQWRIAAAVGEMDLAKFFLANVRRLSKLVYEVDPVPDLESSRLSEAERDEMMVWLLKRLDEEVQGDGARIDELLYSLWALIGDDEARRAMARDGMAELEASRLLRLPPAQRVLVTLALISIQPTPDPALLTPLGMVLAAWFAGTTSLTSALPHEALCPLLHPSLREAVLGVARAWAQGGVERQQEKEWSDAESLFLTGGYCFSLAKEWDEAVRAFLYAVDAAARLRRFDQAESFLARLEEGGGPASTSHVLDRRIKMLAYRAIEGDIEPRVALERATPILARLERIDDGADLGAACLSMATLHHLAGAGAEAVEFAAMGRDRLSGKHRSDAEMQLEALEAQYRGGASR